MHRRFLPFPSQTPRGSWVWLVLAAAQCSLTTSARADEPDGFALAYRVARGCPDQAQFVREVTRRAPRARVVSDLEARRFEVDIVDIGTGFSGRLEVREAESSPKPRQVGAATCAEVTTALALIAALTLDPDASTSALAPEPAATATPRPVVPETPPATPTAPPPARWSFGLGAHAGASGAVAPWVLPTGGIFVETSRVDGSWSARLSVNYAPPLAGTVPLGEARFSLLALRLEACPTIRPAPGLEASACAAFEAGRHHAEGVPGPGLVSTTDGAVWWYAPSLSVRTKIDLADRWFLEANGGLFFPLVRRSFVFRLPSQEAVLAHRAPSVGGGGGIGLGYRFR